MSLSKVVYTVFCKTYKSLNILLVLVLMLMPTLNMYASQSKNCDTQKMSNEKAMSINNQVSDQSHCEFMMIESKNKAKETCCCDSGSCECMAISHIYIHSPVNPDLVNTSTLQTISIITLPLNHIYIPSNLRPPIA